MGGSVSRDSKTCIYPYEDADPRDASAFASAGVDETTRGKREKGSALSTPLWMRDWKGFLWWPLMQKRRNADGASDLEALDGSGGAAFGSENACLFRLYAFFPCMEGGGSQTARRVPRKEVGH